MHKISEITILRFMQPPFKDSRRRRESLRLLQVIPIRTTGLQAQTQNEAGRTVGRTARAAAIGGLIDGRSGARTGAKVGAGASILTGGQSINVPRGTILEVDLAEAVSVRM